MTFAVGDTVWLSTRNLKKSGPSKKLDYKHTGPYMVTKTINKNAYKLDLPSTMRNYNFFHVSLLDHYIPQVGGHPPTELHPMRVEETEESEVNHILDSRQRYRKLHYLVHWAGYNHIHTSWQLAEHLTNARDLVDEFHRQRPDRPLE